MDRKNIENILTLAPGQRGILFHALYEPGSRVYFNQLAVTLAAPLEREALERAWRQVMERHTALRTSFHWEDLKNPLQVVQRQVEPLVRWEDLRALPASEQTRWEESFLAEDRARGFDLSRAPLVRFTVARLGEASTRLIVSYHHILLDAWSFGLVLRDTFALYEAATQNRPSGLEQPRPYGDFIQWLQGHEAHSPEPFWREYLRGVTGPTPLAGDRAPRATPQPGARQEEVRLRLSAETSATLRALAQRHQLTPSSVLHAAWALLLSRYSGESDVVFGSVVSGRSAPVTGIEAMVGLFINTLPFRLRVSPRTTALAFVREAQRVQRELLQREHSQLVQVQAWSEVPRGTPLFESILVFENVRLDDSLRRWAPRPDDLRVRHIEHSSYPLTLVVHDEPELELLLAHDGHRFDSAFAGRMVGHLATLARAMVERPDAPLSELPLLTEAERHQQLVTWNDTRAQRDPAHCVHHLFDAQAERTPDAPAVTFQGQVLRYRELQQRANQLAHRLRRLGIGPEQRVAVCMEPSLEVIFALYGVLKAGGAYVPLAPDSPRERLGELLRDSKAAVLLTQRALRERLPTEGLQVLCLDDPETLANEPTDSPRTGVSPENLAYIVFTSGSTGVPKGVQVTHRSVVNHNLAVAERFQLRPSDRVLQFTPINFDAAVEEIFPPLLCGASIVVRGELVPVLEFSALIERDALTVLSLPPAFMHEWVSELSRRGERLPEGLRLVLLGGEKILPETMALWRTLGGGGVPWINVYGPTEATVTSALCELGDGGLQLQSPVLPIGGPIANARIYLLDAHLQPVPVGIPGELFIAGAGLARGYLHQPALTGERFLPDPFATEPGARMYRTGDLARYLPDGRIEFLGRVDTQFKIRGNRVEPGEVEAALRKHAGIQDAVAVAHEAGPGDTRLVAYVVPARARAPSAAELRGALKDRLPDYMVPSAFVVLDALPLTPNGKVDRKALPPPDFSGSERAAYLAPRTPAEESVARAFSEVLQVARVGATDDFFALGGHSLLATQVVSRLRAAFQRELPLRLLFEFPSVSGLAERLTESPAATAASTAADRTPAPLSFAQERLWFIHQLEPDSAAYNIPLEIRLRGTVDVPALERTLLELVTRHEVLRTTFAREDGRALQHVQPIRAWTLPIIDLSALPSAERERQVRQHATEEMRRLFDLQRGPLLRTVLLRLSEQEHLLLLTAHHIAVDGWSLAVLGRELVALYPAFREGQPSPLPPPTSQYGDFARRQRASLTGEVVEQHLGYWKRKLQGATTLQLPTDRPPPAAPSYRRGMKVFHLDPALVEGLRGLARRGGASFFMTLLAAYKAVLFRYTGQEDLLLGTDIANRTPETEGLVGYFVNQLPLRTDLSGDPAFLELLARVRETTLGAYAHEELPFEELVKVWNPERSAYHHGPLQVKLTYQRFDAPSLARLADLGIEVEEQHSETTQFQFAVVVDEIESAVRVTVNYHADLFDAATADRFAGHLTSVLEAAVRDPSMRLSELPLLTGAERNQLLAEWNATRTEFPSGTCVPDLFETQSLRTPDALAVVHEGTRLTYRELDARANQLARLLRAHGVGPEARVALVLEPSVETVVALLGVLKAGGAYVPIAPDAPPERIAFVLADAGARVVLTQGRLLGQLPTSGLERLALDSEPVREALTKEPDTRPERRLTPDHLAYVIYTSGSTGEPKGVLLQHRGVVNHNLAVAARFGLTAGDRVLQFTPINFDAAVEEIFPPLATGAAVVIRGELVPTSQFAPLVEREGLTVLSLPPAWLHEWVSDLTRRGEPLPRGLRLVLLGGEKILPESLALWRGLGGERIPWLNVYGPTEATVTAAMCQVGGAEGKLDLPVLPIGGPIANVRIHVLDARLQPVPINVPGELYIGGPGLARGYLGRPGQTAERFIPDPFSAEPGARLYRTGDLARYNGRGQLEFLGRADSQVKLRGFRIEPGEIEATLRKHPGVQDAVVIAREDTPGDKRLVAYVVSTATPPPRGAELRAHLFKTLPDYMVPAAFVTLEALPLTANGKVDRKALPAPDPTSEDPRDTVWPRTPTEARLVELFEEALGATGVGVTDDFFTLGGHSLSAVRLIERILETLGRTVELTDLFEQATVEHLAEVLERTAEGTPTAASSLLVALQPNGDRPPLFLAPAAGGTALHYFPLAKRLGAEQPVYAFQSPGVDTEEAPLTSIEALAARFVAAIREVQPHGPYRLGGYSMGGTLAFEMARQLTAAGEQVALLALLDTFGPALERRMGSGNLVGEGAEDGLRLLGGHYGIGPEQLSTLGETERWDYVHQRLTASGVVPPGFPVANLQRLARVYGANAWAHSHYAGGPYTGSVTLIRADASARHGGPALGWAELVPGRVELLPVAGDHQGMLAGAQLEAVAQQLRARLERTRP
ncbi:amino acid adenylation domain-containing protein [Myxococcaceae bacterium GXIMD 01537]